MPKQLRIREKNIVTRLVPKWHKLQSNRKVRFGAWKDKDTGLRRLVGLNYEGRFATGIAIEGTITYAFFKTLVRTYGIPVEYQFEQRPFPL